jgi:peptidoglycan-associated lipoprotein
MQLRVLLLFVLVLAACAPHRRHEPVRTPSTGDIQRVPPDRAPVEPRPQPNAVAASRLPPIVAPPPPVEPEPPAEPSAVIAEIQSRLLDAYFDYDRSDLRSDAVAALQHNAELLRALFARFPEGRVTIEGHCDERGSAAYNLALGDQRARRAAGFIGRLGVPAERVEIVSFGNEAPQCVVPAESCWQRNRRAHFRVTRSREPNLSDF